MGEERIMNEQDPYAWDIKATQGSRNVFELMGIVQRLAEVAENQLDGERDTNQVHMQEIDKLKTRIRQDELGTEYLRQENRTLREERKEWERSIDAIIINLGDAYRLKDDYPEHLQSAVKGTLDVLTALRPSTTIPF